MLQTQKIKMMKRVLIMAVLLTGLFFAGVIPAVAQQNCLTAAELDNDSYLGGTLTDTICWVKKAESGEKDLRGAYLEKADLRFVDLSNANLSNAFLSNANLSNANLSNANLSNAFLENANLSNANLRGANFTGADLMGANLRGADLRGTNFTGANLIDAEVGRSNLSDTGLQCKVATQGGNLNLRNIDEEIIGQLKNRSVVYKNGQTMDDGTISISERKGAKLVMVGFVAGQYLNCENWRRNTSTNTNDQNQINLTQCTVATMSTNLNVRQTPTPKGTKIGSLSKGSTVYLNQYSNDRRWANVSKSQNGRFVVLGWVSAAYLRCN